MAFDVYLIIEDGKVVAGESTDDAHKNGWIKLSSFSFGASNPAKITAGKQAKSDGQPSLSSFMVTKDTESSSVTLFKACCQGIYFKSMKVEVCTQSGKKNAFCVFEFNDVYVDGIQWSATGSTSDRPVESVSFAFGSVQTTYFTLKTDGTQGTKVGPVAWSITQNLAAMNS